MTCLFLLLSLHLARSGFFLDLLAVYEMTSLTPLDAAAIWRLRTDLKPRALISMVYVPTKYQLADLLTKSTTAATFSRIMPMLTGYARFDHSRYTS